MRAVNQLLDVREEIITNFMEMKELLFGTTQLSLEQEILEKKVNEFAEAINLAIEENARVALGQSEYDKSYNGLVKQFEDANAKLEAVKDKILKRNVKRENIEGFVSEIEKFGMVGEYDEEKFQSLVECMTVGHEEVIVQFKDGSEVRV